MHVIFELNLPRPLTGEDIKSVVESVAKQQFRFDLVSVINSTRAYQISRVSSFSSEDVCICTNEDGNSAILLDKTYDKLYVCHTAYGGMKFAVLEREDRIIDEVEKFRDELQAEIDSREIGV